MNKENCALKLVDEIILFIKQFGKVIQTHILGPVQYFSQSISRDVVFKQGAKAPQLSRAFITSFGSVHLMTLVCCISDFFFGWGTVEIFRQHSCHYVDVILLS